MWFSLFYSTKPKGTVSLYEWFLKFWKWHYLGKYYSTCTILTEWISNNIILPISQYTLFVHVAELESIGIG